MFIYSMRKGERERERAYLILADFDCFGGVILAVEPDVVDGVFALHAVVHVDDLQERHIIVKSTTTSLCWDREKRSESLRAGRLTLTTKSSLCKTTSVPLGLERATSSAHFSSMA